MEISPRAIFERLFGDGESTDPAARLKLHEAGHAAFSTIVRGDVARLEPGLGSRDKSKLDEYLEAIRDIERRIQKAEEQSATMKIPVMERPVGIPETFEEHAKLMSDLMVIACQTDMTRVITFMMAREGCNRSYREIGVPDGHHSVTHHQNDPEKIAKTQKIDEHHVKSFAYLVKRLNETPGWRRHAARPHACSSTAAASATATFTIITICRWCSLAVKAADIKGGRHLRYKPETPMNNLLLTMLDKAGVQAETLGDSTGKIDQLAGV